MRDGILKLWNGRSKFVLSLTLAVVSLSVVVPFLWVLVSSLKSDSDIFLRPFAVPSLDGIQWRNYVVAWSQGHIGSYFLNSVGAVLATLVGTLLVASMAAYALARYSFRGASALHYFFLSGLMVPIQLSIIPLFFELRAFHLLGSIHGLVIVYIATNIPFAVFVLAGFFKSIPLSLYEAGSLDGASEWRIYWSIMLPLSRSGLLTVAIFTFLNSWNEYLLAYMLLAGNESAKTLPIGLADITVVSQYRSDWGVAFAGLVYMILPCLLVYVLLQKNIVKGMTAGSAK